MLRFRRIIRLLGCTAISGVLSLVFLIYLLNSFHSNQTVIVSKTVKANHIAAQEAWAASVLGQAEQFDTSVQYCQVIPSSTGGGRLHINTQFLPWTTIEGNNLMLEPGGRYKPPNCRARSRVAIVIPYRDREKHLNIFLQYMHPFLQRQQLDYGIFVVEQLTPTSIINIFGTAKDDNSAVTGQQFNRGMLKNIGFVEAMKSYDYQCVIFNDVDLLPENDLIFYTCPSMPRHLSVAVNTFGYKLPYEGLLGGVVAMSKDHFTKINGYSNLYFEWGAEDDDLGKRVIYNNLTVDRFAPEIARFIMTKHARDTKSRSLKRYALLITTKLRWPTDGLNSLRYELLKQEVMPLYTRIYVSINQQEVLDNEPFHRGLLTSVLSLIPF